MSAGKLVAASSDGESAGNCHGDLFRRAGPAANRSWGAGFLNQPDDPQTAGIAALQLSIPSLRRYALVLLRDREGVEDLVHDCLVQALTHMRTRKAGDIRPWLFSIMHNLFISQKRRERRRGQNISIESMIEFGVEGRLNIEAAQEDRLRWRDLLRALNELPLELRQVVTLVSVEELSYAAVAEVLGIPIGTVMSRLSRGRERLRQMMVGEWRPILRSVK
jgi:RNA polymerase sigma-70 factor (ECF subfamily)